MKKAKKAMAKEMPSILTKDYAQTLSLIKKQIQEAQVKAILSVNKELMRLYWSIGKIVTEKQATDAWGSSVIERLAEDLQGNFPGIAGFSRANVFRMKAFYVAYEKVAQAVRQIDDLPVFNIPWGHNVVLLQKIKSDKERLWYAQKAIEQGWSRISLETWIKSDLYNREGRAVTNFTMTLPMPDSAMAQQSLKDPYLFDFLALHDDHIERDIEQGLIDHIQKFLLELGQGFAFVGRQVHLEVSGKDYYIDLLFYHFRLKCFVVIELKAREFDPRDAGQINFYLSAVDEAFKALDDNPTIGLLLCKSKDKLTVEYALRRCTSPIGVASYETLIMEKLPKEFKSSLPTVEAIEAELGKQKILSREEAKFTKTKKSKCS